jgi:hypothetical protein
MHPFAPHIGPCRAPQFQRAGVLDKVDADLLENRLGVVLDDLDGLVVQDLEIRDRAGDEARSARRAAPPPPRWRRPAPASARSVIAAPPAPRWSAHTKSTPPPVPDSRSMGNENDIPKAGTDACAARGLALSRPHDRS